MGGSPSKPAETPELDQPWRNFDWGEKDKLKEHLEYFQLKSQSLTHIKILVAGQIGAGKSSFINSVVSAFQGKIISVAQTDASDSAISHSFTQTLKAYRIRRADADLPFEICDIMGLEPHTLLGIQPDDVVKTIHGHVKEGYKFTENPIGHKNESYKETPSLSDQAFCLVYVVDANTIQFSSNDNILIEKLRLIRKRISDEGIPQVVVLTKVDELCPLVKKDLQKVFYSKKIREAVRMCNSKIGVPMNLIFPVKNYHEETQTNDVADVLILNAFQQIVCTANERLSHGFSHCSD
ncbi:interferon-induced protein 44 [Danio rerio]|uniref:Interferon-induced protein 44 n=1 Tax=Danio rerio TaxID=7955 RepID=A0A8M3AXQ2_DANRE|nr:interferon-induced protein 44-like [Danio rerio]|eukprot:XP_009304400.1 interferon-induced protein 44-like [Danio rerio]